MDPEIEIEQAIQDARRKDQQLRNQAAQVIAHRTQVTAQLENTAADVAEAKELAKQALLRADAATRAGNAAEAEKWNAAATSVAMRLQAAQNNEDMLRKQLVVADEQAEKAKQAVQANAASVQELAAKRMELLGQLEAAKMQEKVNDAMASMTATVGQELAQPGGGREQDPGPHGPGQRPGRAGRVDGRGRHRRAQEIHHGDPGRRRRSTRCGPSSGWAALPSCRPATPVRPGAGPPSPELAAAATGALRSAAPYHAPVIVLVLGGTRQRQVGRGRGLGRRSDPPVTYVATGWAAPRGPGHGRAHRRPPGRAGRRAGSRSKSVGDLVGALAQLSRPARCWSTRWGRGWPLTPTSPSTSMPSSPRCRPGRARPWWCPRRSAWRCTHRPRPVGASPTSWAR